MLPIISDHVDVSERDWLIAEEKVIWFRCTKPCDKSSLIHD